jgi:hypothetical protein
LARRYAAVVGALTIANLTWTEAATPVQHARTTPLQWSFWHILGHVLNRLRTRTVQLFGNFGWLDTSLPFLSIAIYLGLVILLFALTVASPLHRWRRVVAYGFFVTLVLPIVSEVSQARWYGFPWQGRYILPFAVGIPLMAAFALRNGSLLPEAAARRLLVAVTVGVAIAQTGAFWWALDRYQVGAGRSHNPLAGSWHPPVTSGGAIAFFGVGVVMFTAFGVWLARTRERSPLSPLPS